MYNQIEAIQKAFDCSRGMAIKIEKATNMNMKELLAHPDLQLLLKKCYNLPMKHEMILELVSIWTENDVQGFELPDGEFITYVNVGDCYEPTLLYYNGEFMINSVGDLIEDEGLVEYL